MSKQQNKPDPWAYRKSIFRSHAPNAAQNAKIKWRIFPILWLALKRMCTALGAAVLISMIISVWTLSSLFKDANVGASVGLPEQMVLFMDFKEPITDLPQEISFADPFSDNSMTVKNLVDAINRAKFDPRVEGIYARLTNLQLSVTHVQEVRESIRNFTDSGKFAYVYAPSYNGGIGSYYFASSFDEIWMQPIGTVMIPGIKAEIPFIRDALDKIGVEPNIYQRKEYKTAYESLTNRDISIENRESMDVLIDDIASVLFAGISASRNISENDFLDLVDQGLFVAEEAKEAKLIDYADYADNLVNKINEKVTGNPETEDLSYIPVQAYINDMLSEKAASAQSVFQGQGQHKKTIALIYAVGAIMETDSNNSKAPSIMADDGVAAADEIAGALIEAAYNDQVEAVVLRVDSPGGSPIASETILRAIEMVQEKKKKVIVSMGPTAASGGYWISAPADYIFALPTTITGSIGVLGGKVSLEELWKTLGVNWARVGFGKNASIYSMNTSFSKSEEERIEVMLDNIYVNFLERVSEGRDIPISDVEKLAKGRVWSGKKALELGLVDQFGTLNDALDFAAKELGLEDRFAAHVAIIPKPKTPVERFLELLEGQVYAGQVIGSQAHLFERLNPVLEHLQILENPQNLGVYAPPPHIQ
ncbi:MAG: signal peptide peptidase SppA [Alphaproteobacteria bacterium]|nr:signal peptide peptidase SppA [Alphaproteobacteria bacterium]